MFSSAAAASAERMHRHTVLTAPSHSARRTGTPCGMPSASAAVTTLRVNAAGVKRFVCCFMTAVSPSPAFARY